MTTIFQHTIWVKIEYDSGRYVTVELARWQVEEAASEDTANKAQ